MDKQTWNGCISINNTFRDWGSSIHKLPEFHSSCLLCSNNIRIDKTNYTRRNIRLRPGIDRIRGSNNILLVVREGKKIAKKKLDGEDILKKLTPLLIDDLPKDKKYMSKYMELTRARGKIDPTIKTPLEKDAIRLLNSYKKALDII